MSAAAAALAIGLSGCLPDSGLRVEQVPSDAPPTMQTAPPAGPADEPFDSDEIRRSILDDSTLSDQPGYAQITDVLLVCSECLDFGSPFSVDGQRFQIAMIATPDDSFLFAGVVVSESEGAPQVNLIVSGHDLTLTPGREGTLVAQESTYRTDDPDCCPSGWSVRVFRYTDGRFEAGQRITQNSADDI